MRSSLLNFLYKHGIKNEQILSYLVSIHDQLKHSNDLWIIKNKI